jgi:tyrosinase
MLPKTFRFQALILIGVLCGIRGLVAAPLAVRPSVRQLTPLQRTNIVRCVLWLKSHPSAYDTASTGLNAYDWMVKLHKDGFEAHLVGGSGVHMSPSFFPWHREYLRAFERELQRAAGVLGIPETVTLPYWDWTDPATAEEVFRDDFMGGNGSGTSGAFTTGLPSTRNSPFRVRTGPFATRDDRTSEFPVNTNTTVSGTSPQGPPRVYLQRSIGTHRIFGGTTSGGEPPVLPTADQLALLPTPEQIRHGLEMTLYDMAAWDYTVETNVPFLERSSFRNYMEGHTGLLSVFTDEPFGDQLHGRVHLWIGGNMSSSSSPNDPLFWLHHANLDRIWAEWQDRHGVFNYPSEWSYTDAASNSVPVSAADPLWGFNRSAGYPAEITSLDVLELRAKGVRYDTMTETGTASLTAELLRSAGGTTVEVRVASLRGIQYWLEAAAQPAGPWIASGSPVIATGNEVRFERTTETAGSPGEFLRILASAPADQPRPQSLNTKDRSLAPSRDPVCGVLPEFPRSASLPR